VRRLIVLASFAVALWAAPGALAAGWCGTGESATDRPDVTTGQQVHAIVVSPADVADNFAADANTLADDVASMTAWWQGQDPTRVPRFDTATFPSGTCLDISFVRLPDPASAYVGAVVSFDLVVTQLLSGGFANTFKKYYVYYDGPAVQANVCGAGADLSPFPSFAVVWLAGCAGRAPTDSIGTHELLHALGALPDGAPNWCRASPVDNLPDTGHPCDSPTDILYPQTHGQPLSEQVLDFGHDDYYGHSGSWVDIQDSLWLHRLDEPQFALGVTLSGAGEVSSDLPGLDCSASCSTQWDQGSTVTLSTQPVNGTRFVRWQGGCTGNSGCTVSVAAPLAVTAVFGPVTVPVRLSTSGRGRIACSPACSRSFSAGDPLTLRAVPVKGWRFVAWSGACKGKRLTCAPPTDFPLSVKATFRKR
jgi:hypothetical protein